MDYQTIRSPASAGIDPIDPFGPLQCKAFPRKRGDRPLMLATITITDGVPPQARG